MVTDRDAENAIKLLIEWIGDDPARLEGTPARTIGAFRELFSGYRAPLEVVSSLFPSQGYHDLIVFRGIDFVSHCEHHFLPMRGQVNLAYLPDALILGVGRVVKLIDIFAKRLQMQEKLTRQIAEAFNQYLAPKGVIVSIKAEHDCMMCTLGINKRNLEMETVHALGVFETDQDMRRQFFCKKGE